jgi:hypothetical protein
MSEFSDFKPVPQAPTAQDIVPSEPLASAANTPIANDFSDFTASPAPNSYSADLQAAVQSGKIMPTHNSMYLPEGSGYKYRYIDPNTGKDTWTNTKPPVNAKPYTTPTAIDAESSGSYLNPQGSDPMTEGLGETLYKPYLKLKQLDNRYGFSNASRVSPEARKAEETALRTEADNRSGTDQDLNDSLGGMIGGFEGNIALGSLLPGGGMYGKSGGLLSSITNQGVQSALTPDVTGGPRSVAKGAAGAVGGALGWGAMQPVSRLIQPFASKLTPEQQANIDLLKNNGVDALNVAQRTGSKGAQVLTRVATDNPYVGGSALAERFNTQVDGALLKTAGIPGTSLDSSVLSSAKDALVQTKADGFLKNPMNDLTPPIPGGTTLRTDMDTIIAGANKAGVSGGPNLDDPVSIINHIRKYTDRKTGDIDPEVLHDMQPYISSLGTSENPAIRKWGGILADTLNYHLQHQETVPGAGAAVLDANQKLSNLHKLIKGIPATTGGNMPTHINPVAVARSIDAGDRAYGASQFALTPGTSPQNLLDIAQAASSMKDTFPQSGTAPRLLGSLLLGGAGAALGEFAPGGDKKRAMQWAAAGIGAPLVARALTEGGPGFNWLPKYVGATANSPLAGAISSTLNRGAAAAGGNLLSNQFAEGFAAPPPTKHIKKHEY